MRRQHLYLGLVAAVTASALFVWRSSSGAPQPADGGPPAGERRPEALPLGQVVLFNSGVGYFQREGTIEGDAHVDLQFPAVEVNDLLKSLVLQDLGRGKVAAVSYDGQEPVERTLKTFALDLTGNPTFGQLLNQARGEKVEVTVQNGNAANGTLTGSILGMESQQEPGPREVHQLNLLCAEGMRSLPLHAVQRVRFLNPVLDAELRRALDVLAGSHNSQKKRVSVHFAGEGKRTVKVGYVVEAPMWKSSYRLVLDREAKKTTLQGWAVVENTSEEDWKDVRLALVASRPISFQMDLYQPLFVPRPVVEPERFASLRPPVYEGAMVNNAGNLGNVGGNMGQVGGNAGLGGIGGQGFNQLGVAGGFQGNFQGQGFGGFQGQGFNRYQLNNNFVQLPGVNRLTYEQLQQRRQEREKARDEAKKAGSAIAGAEDDAVKAAVLAETVNDEARYAVDHKVSLARQRSALLPLVDKEVAARRVSIFNDRVHGKFPLRGLKVKNVTGHNLMAGPVSVYEGGSYAGDGRLPDLQANEERLLSYAVDQAVEVKAEAKNAPEALTSVRVEKGVVEETHLQRGTTRYLVRNRAGQERTLIVEHPVNTGWKLVGAEKPAERSRDFYRFEWDIPAGKALLREVTEERTRRQKYALLPQTTAGLELLARSSAVGPKLREALQKAVELKGRLADTQREVSRLKQQFNEVTQEQNRVRTSLDKVPDKSPLQQRYLEKLDKLETDIESLQKQLKEWGEKEKKQEADYEQYVSGLTAE